MDAPWYCLPPEVSVGQDDKLSYDALVTRYNSDLANGLSNLASRTAALIERNFGGKIPKAAERRPQDDALANEVQAAIGEVLENYENLSFARALEAIWGVISSADKYLTTEQPWALGNSEKDKARKATVLWNAAELLRIVTVLAHPVLPASTAKVWTVLRLPGSVPSVQLDGL